MKILLLGSTGMLGSDCKLALEREHEVLAPDRKKLDIVSWDNVIETMQRVLPDAVINCAGMADINECESDELSLRKINVEGPRNLAQGCARFDCRLIHISSYCVYNGLKSIPQPYFEDDTVDPLSSYGSGKVFSETAVRENAPHYIIIRTGWLYGIKGKNFVTNILLKALEGGRKKQTIQVEEDQYGSPTWTYRLAYQIREMLREDVHGTYHATSEGYCNLLDFARAVLDKLNIKANLKGQKTSQISKHVPIVCNGILENRLLKKQGINIMQDWKTDLDLFLDQNGEELIKRIKNQLKQG
ncbi:MAG: SDR family oxidoreductase [Thermodesulfobacteriota bacterium]